MDNVLFFLKLILIAGLPEVLILNKVFDVFLIKINNSNATKLWVTTVVLLVVGAGSAVFTVWAVAVCAQWLWKWVAFKWLAYLAILLGLRIRPPVK